MKKAKNSLIRLMDYQHFKHNEKLKHLIEESVEEYETHYPLSDDAIDISAAGDIDAMNNAKKENVTEPVLSAKKTKQ